MNRVAKMEVGEKVIVYGRSDGGIVKLRRGLHCGDNCIRLFVVGMIYGMSTANCVGK